MDHSMGSFVTRAAVSIYKAPIISLHPDIQYNEFSEFVNVPPVDDTSNTSLQIASASASRINIDDPAVIETIDFNDQMEEAFRKFPSMYELLPDPFYLDTKPILYTDNKPVLGVDNTYIECEWSFKEDYAISQVEDAMKFKKEELLKDLPGSNNVTIYGTDLPTDDTVAYLTGSSTPGTGSRSATTVAIPMFSAPYDFGQKGDSWVPKLSAMGSMEGIEEKNSKHFEDTHRYQITSTLLKRYGNF
jgi:hypothetical protein